MIKLQTSVLSNYDGSAELETEGYKVIVFVNGPIEPKARQELPNIASLEVIVKPSKGSGSPKENLINDKLRSILSSLIIRHKYPRQLISINVQIVRTELDSIIINNFENTVEDLKIFNLELSTIINCCYFALIDANIALYESFVAIHQCLVENTIIQNPKLNTVIKSTSNHILVVSIKDDKPNKLIYIDSKGIFTQDDLLRIVDDAFDNLLTTFNEFKNLINEKVEKDFIWK